MDALLTVIIQTSPLPSHPSAALIEALFRSFDRVTRLKECNIVILCDGCEENESSSDGEDDTNAKSEARETSGKPNYKHGAASKEAADGYRLHLELLQEKIDNAEPPFNSSNGGTMRLLKLPHRHGSAKAIEAAFRIVSISTSYVFIGQHDNFFVRDVPYLEQMIRYMEREEIHSWLHCVHFPSTATLNYAQKVKRRYGLDIERYSKKPHDGADISLQGEFLPLVFWYGRTHIARTRYYTDMILATEHPLKVGDHLEEIWGTKQLDEMKKLSQPGALLEDDAFEAAHSKYGNYVYFEGSATGVNQREVLYHLSGRKVRAASTTSVTEDHSTIDGGTTGTESFNPKGKSFTIARAAKAVVPGLEFIDETDKSSQRVAAAKAKSFRQKCFHCGEKGHSFKFCPNIIEGNECTPNTNIIDLSSN